MRSRRTRLILATCGVLLIAAGGLVIWSRTAHFQRVLDGWLNARLRAVNLRADMTQVRLRLWPLTIDVEGMRIFPGHHRDPILIVPRARARLVLEDLISRTFSLAELDVERPQIFLFFDPTGRANFADIDLSSLSRPRAPKPYTVRLGRVRVSEGSLALNDRRHNLDLQLEAVRIALSADAGTSAEAPSGGTRLEGEARRLDLVWNGRQIVRAGMQWRAHVTRERMRLERLRAVGDVGDLLLAGTIANWLPSTIRPAGPHAIERSQGAFPWTPQYDLLLVGRVHLDPLASRWPSPIALSGDLALQGRIRGEGRRYRFEATLSAARAVLLGIQMRDGRVAMRTHEIAPSSSEETRIVLHARAGALAAPPFHGQELEATGTLPGPMGELFLGTFRSPHVYIGPIPLHALRARVRWDAEQLGIEEITGDVLGGRLFGEAYVRGSEIRVDLPGITRSRGAGSRGDLPADSIARMRIVGVDARDLATHLLVRPLPFESRISGHLTLRWPGRALSRATGTLVLTCAPDSGPASTAARRRSEGTSSESKTRWDTPGSPAGSSPARLIVRGTAEARVSSQGLRLISSSLTIGRARATISGLIRWGGDTDLTLAVRSEDLSEHEHVWAAWGWRLKELTRGLVARLSGTGEYRLHVVRHREAFTVNGEGEIGGFPLAGEIVRSLRARFTYARGRGEIEHAHVLWETGARADLSLTVHLDEENGLAIRGSLHRVTLRHWLTALPIEMPVDGKISGTIALSGLPGAPTGTAEIVLEDGVLGTPQPISGSAGDPVRLERPVRFRRLAGTFHLAPPRYEISDAQLDLRFGTVALSGSVRTDSGDYALRVRADRVDLEPLLRTMFGRTANLTGELQLELSGHGTLADPHLSGHVRVRALTIAGRPAGEIAAEVKTERGRLLIPITATLFGQTHVLQGTLDLTDPSLTVRVRARVEDLSLTPYLRLARRLNEWNGTMSGDVDVRWPLGSPSQAPQRISAEVPSAQLVLRSLNLSFADYALRARHPVTLHVRGRRMKIEPMVLTGENTSLEIAGTLDLGEFFDRGRSTPGHEVDMNGMVDLRLLRGLYPGLFASGRATLRASLRGALARPQLSGMMEIADLSLRLLDLPVSLTQGEGRIRFTASQALIETLRAHANDGEVTVSGGILLRNLRADQWRLAIRSEAVTVVFRGVRAITDGHLVLQGNRQLQILSGLITVRRAEYTHDVELAQLLLASAGSPRRAPAWAIPVRPPLSLDIRVQALDTLAVRNNVADAMGSASLHIGGTLHEPILSGNLVVTRGILRFRNREYQITRGRIDFPTPTAGSGIAPNTPRFQIESESDIAGYRVIVGLSGTLDRFQTTLRSEPALPPDQILSLIVTGDISRATVPAPQTGLGAATALFVGELTHRAQEFTGKIFGINRFQVDPLLVGRGPDPTARLTVGRQVTRNLSILYATNLSGPQEQVILVEYRLSDRLSLVGTRDQDGTFSFDVRIRKRF